MIDPNFLNPLKLLCRSSFCVAQAVTSLKLLPRSSCYLAQAVTSLKLLPRSSCFSTLKLLQCTQAVLKKPLGTLVAARRAKRYAAII
jgi:hypothetical protein